MKQNKWLSVFVALFLIFSSASAEEIYSIQEHAYVDATATLQDWLVQVDEDKVLLTDGDSQIILDMCRDAMLMYQSILLEAVQPEKVVVEPLGDMLPREGENGWVDNNRICSTPICWFENFGLYLSCDILYRQDYLHAQYTLYDMEGMYVGNLVTDIGNRDDESVYLIIDYDHNACFTGRFALKASNGAGTVVFTKTLGQHMNLRLDVDKWQAGAELGEWDKKLLLPVTTEGEK